MIVIRAIAAAAGLTLAPFAPASAADTARAAIAGPEGNSLGSVEFRQTAHGVLLTARLSGLPTGLHGFHIHETGKCSPDFKAAGDHYAPADHEHGFMREQGPHAGDMPNIHVPQSGELTVEILNPWVSLNPDAENTLLDADGSAIVIHADADDYDSQPSGDAGDRIGCGVIR